jgi:catechol 2,3-dioxygenase-like lactoylglutathione lyase family enzyme
MPVTSLDHVNLRVADLAASMAFYRDVLGMTVALAPGQTDFSRGAWILNAASRPVIHMGDVSVSRPGYEGEAMTGSGAVHHIALECTDYEQMLARIHAAGLEPRLQEVSQARLRQIFVQDPQLVLLELNFRDSLSL